MTCKRVQRLILTSVRSGRLWPIHLGTPCTRWSAARTIDVRTDGGLECAQFTVRLLRACMSPIRRALHPRESESISSLEVTAARRRSAPGVSPFRQLPAAPVRNPLQEADDPRGFGPRLRRPHPHLQLPGIEDVFKG